MGVSIHRAWMSAVQETEAATTLTIPWGTGWDYIPVAGDLIVIVFDFPIDDLCGSPGWTQATSNAFYKIVDKIENSPTFTHVRGTQRWQWKTYVALPGSYELKDDSVAIQTTPVIVGHEGELSV